MNIQLDSTRSAAIADGHYWISIDDHPPPAGVKLLLINRTNGVAVLGTYQAKHQWTHWQGLPHFHDKPEKGSTP